MGQKSTVTSAGKGITTESSDRKEQGTGEGDEAAEGEDDEMDADSDGDVGIGGRNKNGEDNEGDDEDDDDDDDDDEMEEHEQEGLEEDNLRELLAGGRGKVRHWSYGGMAYAPLFKFGLVRFGCVFVGSSQVLIVEPPCEKKTFFPYTVDHPQFISMTSYFLVVVNARVSARGGARYNSPYRGIERLSRS